MNDTSFLVFVLGVVCNAAISVVVYLWMISCGPDEQSPTDCYWPGVARSDESSTSRNSPACCFPGRYGGFTKRWRKKWRVDLVAAAGGAWQLAGTDCPSNTPPRPLPTSSECRR